MLLFPSLDNVHMCFSDALEHVYDENRYPLRKHNLNNELWYTGGLNLQELVGFFFLLLSYPFALWFHWIIIVPLTLQTASIIFPCSFGSAHRVSVRK